MRSVELDLRLKNYVQLYIIIWIIEKIRVVQIIGIFEHVYKDYSSTCVEEFKRPIFLT